MSDSILRAGDRPPYIECGMKILVGGRVARVTDIREDDSDQWRGATVADLTYLRSRDTSTAACSWLRAQVVLAEDFDPDINTRCDNCGCVATDHAVDDEERRECTACECEQYEISVPTDRDREPSEDPREVGYQAPVAPDHLIPSEPPSPTGGPMLSREATAIALLKSAISWEPEARLVGGLRACELAALAASIVTCCPKCGAEPWVNIDCDLCLVATALTAGEVP